MLFLPQALLQSSHFYYEAQRDLAKHGLEFDNLRLNMPNLLKQKDQAVSNLTKGIEFLFKKNKVLNHKVETQQMLHSCLEAQCYLLLYPLKLQDAFIIHKHYIY